MSGAAGAVVVALTGGLVLATVELGPLSTHMAHHIALMNVLAPAVAVVWRRSARARQGNTAEMPLWATAATQLALLWGWHAPAAQSWALGSVPGQLVMHFTLFVSALFFWNSVLKTSGPASWKAILALLVTGKIVCLLGVLLIFSPRLLYSASPGQHVHGGLHEIAAAPALADQQLAGLLMIAACPVSYLLAGVVIAARMIGDIGLLDRENESERAQLAVGQ